MSSNPFDPGSASDSSVGHSGRDGDAPAVELQLGPILQRCLEIFQNNPGIVLGSILLPLIPSFLIFGADLLLQTSIELSEDEFIRLMLELVSSGLSILSWLIGVFFLLGQVEIYIGLARGQDVDLNMLVGGGPRFLWGVFASFLMAIISTLGCCLLIVPGIIAGMGLQFTIYALVDQDLGPLEALSESWRLTEGYKLTLFLFNFVVVCCFLGLFCVTMGIGALVAWPVIALMPAVMYHSLVYYQDEAF